MKPLWEPYGDTHVWGTEASCPQPCESSTFEGLLLTQGTLQMTAHCQRLDCNPREDLSQDHPARLLSQPRDPREL